MVKNYVKYKQGDPITINTTDIILPTHRGKWYAIDSVTHNGREVFLLEHEIYGDEAYGVAVDAQGNVVCEEITDDFPECLDY